MLALCQAKNKRENDREIEMTKNDGGPAFPQKTVPSEEISRFPGMSLRDWFAGQVLAGFVHDKHEIDTYEKVAIKSYRAADAMLAERSKREEPSLAQQTTPARPISTDLGRRQQGDDLRERLIGRAYLDALASQVKQQGGADDSLPFHLKKANLPDFIECDSCRQQVGYPLCKGCQANMATIRELKIKIMNEISVLRKQLEILETAFEMFVRKRDPELADVYFEARRKLGKSDTDPGEKENA